MCIRDRTDTTPFHETASRQGEANTDQADEQFNNEASIILKTVGIYKIMNLVVLQLIFGSSCTCS